MTTTCLDCGRKYEGKLEECPQCKRDNLRHTGEPVTVKTPKKPSKTKTKSVVERTPLKRKTKTTKKKPTRRRKR